ncbi:hypothetical protein BCR42DRAFT_349005 [Absidia repens]|uniref:Phosphatidic acid phosphatase type 2/haloperoxidase domain-containing protein n=1 Tax=Absidia repens TaxID=90262 RepID=A0A1X2IL88_9FUNG|nr:hypothetical protein BCR42DRAFT_349005 [Absidia repens]
MVQWSLNGLLAILAQIKFIVSLATFVLIIYTRSIHFMYFVVGACLTAILGKVLKRIFQQSRPQGSGYGMPSTHSQVIMFFATYFHCVAYTSMPSLVCCVSLLALAVVWSRVQLKHHTLSQVTVGTLLGILCALLWYAAWSTILSPLIVEYSPFPRFFIFVS